MSWSDRVTNELFEGLGYANEKPDPEALMRTVLELMGRKEAEKLVAKLVKRNDKLPHGFIIQLVMREVETGSSITLAQEIVDVHLSKPSGYTKTLLKRVGGDYPQWVAFKEKYGKGSN